MCNITDSIITNVWKGKIRIATAIGSKITHLKKVKIPRADMKAGSLLGFRKKWEGWEGNS